MAQYKVTEKSFVNNRLVDAGEIVEYDPPEGTKVSGNLEPIEEDKPAKGGKAAQADG